MPETAKIETLSKNAHEPDPKITMGDTLLEMLKRCIPNAEWRHEMLPKLAKFKDQPLLRNYPHPSLECNLKFSDRSLPITLGSPIILAAGGNKYAQGLAHFAALGFGGISVGSATQSAREGNAFRPRVRLLPYDKAMHNAMGLNNPGIEAIAKEVDQVLGACHKSKLALGISVAESPELRTEDEKIRDVLATFRRAYRAADYVEVNVSCPNTGTERLDSHYAFLRLLLQEIMEVRRGLAPRKAVFAKLSPDMGAKQLDETLAIISDVGITGVVLFNTFPGEKAKFLRMNTAPEELQAVTAGGGLGGLSGRILYKNTLPAVRFIKKQLPHLSIMASGGIDHGEKVFALLQAGADAVQCYTVLAYRWNAIHRMNKELLLAMQAQGIHSLAELEEQQQANQNHRASLVKSL